MSAVVKLAISPGKLEQLLAKGVLRAEDFHCLDAGSKHWVQRCWLRGLRHKKPGQGPGFGRW